MRVNKCNLKEAGKLVFACLFVFLAGCLPTDKDIAIEKTDAGGYTLVVKGEPFLIKGVTYSPTPIGRGFDYELFNDPARPWMIDGKLMKAMGVNCIRLYTYGQDLEKVKVFIRDMYENFGIYTIIGDWLGLWTTCPNYADAAFRENIKKRLVQVVAELKDEEGLLMWVLGNENNYTCTGSLVFWTSEEIENIEDPAQKIVRRAEIYYSLVNEIAAAIKTIDTKHPVALGNGEATLLDVAARTCPNVDVLALIVYRGKRFGNFFENVRRVYDKPVFLSEFGADSYNSYTNTVDEEMQETFLVSQWEDLYKSTTFSQNPKGNCLGGIVFEWTDEWWKHNEGYSPDWDVHNIQAGWSNGSYYFDIRAPNNLNMNEEWFGVVAISEEIEDGINKRIPRRSFYALQKLWAD